jgi:hypothetical protein
MKEKVDALEVATLSPKLPVTRVILSIKTLIE